MARTLRLMLICLRSFGEIVFFKPHTLSTSYLLKFYSGSHSMKSCFISPFHMQTWEYLGIYVMLITCTLIGKILTQEPQNESFWDTPMTRKETNYMICILTLVFSLDIWYSLRLFFHIPQDVLFYSHSFSCFSCQFLSILVLKIIVQTRLILKHKPLNVFFFFHSEFN